MLHGMTVAATTPTPVVAPSLGAWEGRAMVAKLFQALGDPSRLLLLALISERSEATGNECVEKMGLSKGRVSQPLSCGLAYGLLPARRDGRFTVYRVADE